MRRFLFCGLLVMLSLSGCGVFRPYQMPIAQGPLLSAEQIKLLKPGMTKDQVSYVLGTPDIRDPMHANRWDYVYTNEQDYLPRVQKRLELTFNPQEKLEGLAGDYPSVEALSYPPEKN